MADTYADRKDAVDKPVRHWPEFVVQGIPVDPARHPGLYRRTWPEPYRVPGTPGFPSESHEPPPPRVPCRDALPEEICKAAATAAASARASGYVVRVTYAQSGEPERVGPERGRCGACRQVVNLYVETGLMWPHSTGVETTCTGTTHTRGTCDACGRKGMKDLKRGGTSKHDRPLVECSNGREPPHERVPGKVAPPDSSVCVRVKGLGVACWSNGAFDLARLIEDGRYIRSVGADEFQQATKRRARDDDTGGRGPGGGEEDPAPADAGQRLW